MPLYVIVAILIAYGISQVSPAIGQLSPAGLLAVELAGFVIALTWIGRRAPVWIPEAMLLGAPLAAWLMVSTIPPGLILIASPIALGVLGLLALSRLNALPRYVTNNSGGRVMADILARLTNVTALQQRLEESRATITTKHIDAPALKAELKQRIFGQGAAIDAIIDKIEGSYARTKRNRPLATVFLAGPPGTGKTEFGKRLSEVLFGANTALIIEMTKYSEAHTVSSMFGSAKGYAGSDSYGQLTEALLANPNRVVLLDEIEKAHEKVVLGLLNALNDGFATEVSTGEKVSTRDAIFVATSNAAWQQIVDIAPAFAGNPEGLSDAVKGAVAPSFKAEFVDRIDQFFAFLPLGELDSCRLIAMESERAVSEFGLTLEQIDEELLVDTLGRAARRNAGARETTRIVLRQIEPGLIAAQKRGAKAVRLLIDNDGNARVEVVS
jgi:ATP-dependent Clp protease ATP-binding subunit ClpC